VAAQGRASACRLQRRRRSPPRYGESTVGNTHDKAGTPTVLRQSETHLGRVRACVHRRHVQAHHAAAAIQTELATRQHQSKHTRSVQNIPANFRGSSRNLPKWRIRISSVDTTGGSWEARRNSATSAWGQACTHRDKDRSSRWRQGRNKGDRREASNTADIQTNTMTRHDNWLEKTATAVKSVGSLKRK